MSKPLNKRVALVTGGSRGIVAEIKPADYERVMRINVDGGWNARWLSRQEKPFESIMIFT